MSYFLSTVSIRGSHLKAIPDILVELGYKLLVPPRLVSPDGVDSALRSSGLDKATFEFQGSTHILDPELVLCLETEVWAKASERLATSIFTMMAVFDPPTYMFDFYEGGKHLRHVESVPGHVDQSGEPLENEPQIDWESPDEEVFEAFVVEMGSVFYLPDADLKIYVYNLEA